jgi:hypothetical protein
MAITALIPILAPMIGQVIKNRFPDPEMAKRMEADIMAEMWRNSHQLNAAAADIIKTEAASSHWLASNWRPITMIIFVMLIVARWFGWAAPGLSEAEYLKLWSIVEFGLGGYVGFRTLEKITPSITDAIKSRK